MLSMLTMRASDANPLAATIKPDTHTPPRRRHNRKLGISQARPRSGPVRVRETPPSSPAVRPAPPPTAPAPPRSGPHSCCRKCRIPGMLYCARAASPASPSGSGPLPPPPPGKTGLLLLLLKKTPGPACSSMAGLGGDLRVSCRVAGSR